MKVAEFVIGLGAPFLLVWWTDRRAEAPDPPPGDGTSSVPDACAKDARGAGT